MGWLPHFRQDSGWTGPASRRYAFVLFSTFDYRRRTPEESRLQNFGQGKGNAKIIFGEAVCDPRTSKRTIRNKTRGPQLKCTTTSPTGSLLMDELHSHVARETSWRYSSSELCRPDKQQSFGPMSARLWNYGLPTAAIGPVVCCMFSI